MVPCYFSIRCDWWKAVISDYHKPAALYIAGDNLIHRSPTSVIPSIFQQSRSLPFYIDLNLE